MNKIYLGGRQGGWDSYRGVFLLEGVGGRWLGKRRGVGGWILKNGVMTVHIIMYGVAIGFVCVGGGGPPVRSPDCPISTPRPH